jgi:hypothetical protein
VKHHENFISIFRVSLEIRNGLLRNTNLNSICDPLTSAVQSIDVGVYKVWYGSHSSVPGVGFLDYILNSKSSAEV